MSYVLAVDGGNTKTLALIASLDGAILGYGRGECGDIYDYRCMRPVGQDSVDFALANIERTISQALHSAQITAADIVAGVFNMAGADWPEDFVLLHSAMQRYGFGQTIRVFNDALGVLYADPTNDIGVSVVCGTGAAVGARGKDNRVWHSSFWQLDVQGAGTLGRKTLNAVFRAELGLEPSTHLTERILTYFRKQTVEELLYQMTCRARETIPMPHIEGLVPHLLDIAEAGDSIAQHIVREHGEALGDYALLAARRVGIEHAAFPLVLAGGVLRHPSSLLAHAIVERVRTASPVAYPARSQFEPVVGALFAALQVAHVTITSAIQEKLIATIPDRTLFETSVVDDSKKR